MHINYNSKIKWKNIKKLQKTENKTWKSNWSLLFQIYFILITDWYLRVTWHTFLLLFLLVFIFQ